jgi:sulfur relay (sulfurtransferase) DsrC/TusE family protein
MNDKTWQVYEFTREYIERYGYAPAHREIVAACHVGKNDVPNYLTLLAAHSLIDYEPGTYRGIKLK